MFNRKKVGPKVWTTDEFIITFLQTDPANLKSEQIKKIEDRVKRFNVLIPDLNADILNFSEEELEEILVHVNRLQQRAQKYPKVYESIGALIGEEELKEDDLKHMEHVAVQYPLVFENLDPEEIINDYRDEKKLIALNDRLKKEMQADLDQRLEAIQEPPKVKQQQEATVAQPEADSPPVRRRFGCC